MNISVCAVVDHNPLHHGEALIGTNLLKKILKSRRLDASTRGLKGNGAKYALAQRLRAYAAPPPNLNVEAEEEEGAAVAVAVAVAAPPSGPPSRKRTVPMTVNGRPIAWTDNIGRPAKAAKK